MADGNAVRDPGMFGERLCGLVLQRGRAMNFGGTLQGNIESPSHLAASQPRLYVSQS